MAKPRCMAYKIGSAFSAAFKATGARARFAESVIAQHLQQQRRASAAFGSNLVEGESPSREGLPQGKTEVEKGRQGKERVGKDPAGGNRPPPKSATLEQADSFREESRRPGV